MSQLRGPFSLYINSSYACTYLGVLQVHAPHYTLQHLFN